MDLPELQQAVRAIPGVAAATVRWPDPQGPAALRVEFEPGADQREVGEAIIRTLVDVAHVDLATMHLEHGALVEHRPRPVFTGLGLDRVDDELAVEVDVSIHGQQIPGRAGGLLAEHDEVELVAAATLDALHRSEAGPFELHGIEVVRLAAGIETVVAVVGHGAGGRPLVGAAAVGRDVREAAVRATLDAVNRILPVPGAVSAA
jgi:hypothetical protein